MLLLVITHPVEEHHSQDGNANDLSFMQDFEDRKGSEKKSLTSHPVKTHAVADDQEEEEMTLRTTSIQSGVP